MSDINVTPLVDVMLVLVVIFIITAPLLASSIRLDLPKAEGAQPASAALRHRGARHGRARPFLNDQPVTPTHCASAWPRRRSRTPTPRCSCAPTRPCPMAGWSR